MSLAPLFEDLSRNTLTIIPNSQAEHRVLPASLRKAV
jgi:hypothetical protein